MPLPKPARASLWFALVLVMVLLLAAGPARAGGATGATGAEESLPPVLLKARADIQAALERLDQHLAEAARQLSRVELDSSRAGSVLSWLRVKEPQVISAATVSPKGIMMTVKPAEYRHYEGSDISAQPQVRLMLDKHQPVLSRLFHTVEGYWAVALQRPILGPQGEFRGALSVTFHPAPFAKQVLDHITAAAGLKFYLLQKDGTVLYSSVLDYIGLNVLRTPLYRSRPQVREVVARILAQPQGSFGQEHFLGKELAKPVRRRNYWTTVGLFGTQWRLGFAEPIL